MSEKKQKARKTKARLVQVDPSLPVAPSAHLPGSKEKIELLRNRFASGQLLHVEGDLLEGGQMLFTKTRNGRRVDRHSEPEIAGEDGGETKRNRSRLATDNQETRQKSIGSLVYGDRLARRIRSLREEKGWSLGQFALISGVHKSHLHNIESGLRPNPGILTVAAIAEALKVSLDALLAPLN